MITDSKNWLIKHPLGPVHFDVVCNHCRTILKTDLKNVSMQYDMYRLCDTCELKVAGVFNFTRKLSNRISIP